MMITCAVWPIVRAMSGQIGWNVDERVAELVGDDVLHPVAVANRDRPVEMVLDDDVVHVVSGSAGCPAASRPGRPASETNVKLKKRGDDQHRNAVEESPDDVGEHGCGVSLL